MRVTALQTEATEAEEKLKRLYRMVEEGVTDLDEILKARLATVKTDRDKAKAALDRIRERSASAFSFDPEAIERFGRLMRQNISSGDVPFRKAYIRAVLDRIEVDDYVIRMIGDKAALEQTIAAGEQRVRSFVRKWRARKDSNL